MRSYDTLREISLTAVFSALECPPSETHYQTTHAHSVHEIYSVWTSLNENCKWCALRWPQSVRKDFIFSHSSMENLVNGHVRIDTSTISTGLEQVYSGTFSPSPLVLSSLKCELLNFNWNSFLHLVQWNSLLSFENRFWDKVSVYLPRVEAPPRKHDSSEPRDLTGATLQRTNSDWVGKKKRRELRIVGHLSVRYMLVSGLIELF